MVPCLGWKPDYATTPSLKFYSSIQHVQRQILTSAREAEGLSDLFLHKYSAYIWDINISHQIIFFMWPLVHAGLPVWNFFWSCKSGYLVWWAMIFFVYKMECIPLGGGW